MTTQGQGKGTDLCLMAKSLASSWIANVFTVAGIVAWYWLEQATKVLLLDNQASFFNNPETIFDTHSSSMTITEVELPPAVDPSRPLC